MEPYDCAKSYGVARSLQCREALTGLSDSDWHTSQLYSVHK